MSGIQNHNQAMITQVVALPHVHYGPDIKKNKMLLKYLVTFV